MPVHDDLGLRMKTFYEQIPKIKLMRRCPVIVRIDGRSFHSFCKGFQKPFDDVIIKTMQATAKYLCENIQGCALAYTQSDEISLLLIDYQRLESAAFFDYKVQKLCSITASMATMVFNKKFVENYLEYISTLYPDFSQEDERAEYKKIVTAYEKSSDVGAMFDSRCFNIPKEEVTNYFYWRQLDATRNSIQMVGQANFSHKELQNKSCNQIQDMLLTQKDINWNDLPIYKKRGSCCIKEEYQCEDVDIKDGTTIRTRWIVDKGIPIFKGNGREYIDKLVFVGE